MSKQRRVRTGAQRRFERLAASPRLSLWQLSIRDTKEACLMGNNHCI